MSARAPGPGSGGAAVPGPAAGGGERSASGSPDADAPPPAVLVTRPAADAGPLCARLAAAGWRPLPWPLLEIEAGVGPLPVAGAQALLLTSANAARAAAGRLGAAPPPALCVGAATARAARAAGLAAECPPGPGDGAALAAWAARRLDPAAGPVLFLRGEAVAGDPAGALRAAGFAVREAVAYAARPATAAPDAVAAALEAGAVDAALFYSPRAAETFAGLADAWRAGLAGTVAVAISAAAARPLARCGFARVTAAGRPDGAAVEAALAALRGEAAARAAGRAAGAG